MPTDWPLFDGDTFTPARDGDRLRCQLDAVRRLMSDGAWRTLAEIGAAVGAPEASASARLRDLRKPKFGGLAVEREYVRRGLFRYRLAAARPPAQEGIA
jgi:hypothetical protein